MPRCDREATNCRNREPILLRFHWDDFDSLTRESLSATGSMELESARSLDHRHRRAHENFDIEPGRPGCGVAKVKTNHVIELDSAASCNLPQPGDTWLHLEHSPPVPCLIVSQLVRNSRPGSDKRHLPVQDVDELGQFVQTRPAQNLPQGSHAFVVLDFVNVAFLPWRAVSTLFAGNQLGDKLPMHGIVVVHIHGSKLKKGEGLTVLAHPLLLEKDRAL